MIAIICGSLVIYVAAVILTFLAVAYLDRWKNAWKHLCQAALYWLTLAGAMGLGYVGVQLILSGLR